MPSMRRLGVAAGLAAIGDLALAYRFARLYRQRAGYPARHPSVSTPADIGLAFEELTVSGPFGSIPAWFVPARAGSAGPGVVIVHGWESGRDRMLPNIAFLNAAGFHSLTFDVRGHGANPPEALPVTGGEFGADALAAFAGLLERPEVTRGAIMGHSMGGVGAILAAAADPRVAALVSLSAPSDPRLLVRQTFIMANLPIPALVAHPLAWFTSRMYLRPRGHTVRSTSAREAIARYHGPVLLIHGENDDVMPAIHAQLLADAALKARRRRDPAAGGGVAVHIVPGGPHTGLQEDVRVRRIVARFLSEALGGPYTPDEAAERAAGVAVPSSASIVSSAVPSPPPTAESPLTRWADADAVADPSYADGPHDPVSEPT